MPRESTQATRTIRLNTARVSGKERTWFLGYRWRKCGEVLETNQVVQAKAWDYWALREKEGRIKVIQLGCLI
jgi:hypothetical protein